MNNIKMQEQAKQIKNESFTSGFYSNGFEVLKEFLHNNYFGCKVCFVTCGQDFLLFKAFMQSVSTQNVYLLSDDKATNNNFLEVQSVCADCELIVCLDYKSVNFCKKLYTKLKINCFYFFTSVPPVDAFLPYFYEFDGTSYKKIEAKPVTQYIINYVEPKLVNTQEVIDCVCSALCVYAEFLDYYINGYIFGEKLDSELDKNFAYYTKSLSLLLNQTRILPPNFTQKLYDLTLSLTCFMIEKNCFNKKSDCFAKIYKHLSNTKTSSYELAMFSSQIFVHLYSDFFKKFVNFKLSGASQTKKQAMFEKHLHAPYVANEDANQKEKIAYLINRHKQKLQTKCEAFCQIVDKFIDSTLNLYNDCGYNLYKTINKEKVLLALYFVPDCYGGKSLIDVISSYGILDNIV